MAPADWDALAGDQGEDVVLEEPGEEYRVVRPLRDPGEPTRDELDQHNLTHAAYRSWCPHCVRGRGRNAAHSSVQRDADAVPVVTFDYCFLGSGRGASSEASAQASGLTPVLVMHDDHSRGVYAHAVPHKGTDHPGSDLAVRSVCADIDSLGYKRVVFKDDGEAALVSFLDAVKRSWDGEVVPEHSATGETQSHGGAERGVQTVEGFTRTLKDALETHLEQRLPLDCPLMSWFVTHAAGVFRRYSVGSDGRTA